MHTLHKHTLSWKDTPRLEAWVIDKNTGVGSHCLLQGILLTQGLNQGLGHCGQILYCLSHQARCNTCYTIQIAFLNFLLSKQKPTEVFFLEIVFKNYANKIWGTNIEIIIREYAAVISLLNYHLKINSSMDLQGTSFGGCSIFISFSLFTSETNLSHTTLQAKCQLCGLGSRSLTIWKIYFFWIFSGLIYIIYACW